MKKMVRTLPRVMIQLRVQKRRTRRTSGKQRAMPGEVEEFELEDQKDEGKTEGDAWG